MRPEAAASASRTSSGASAVSARSGTASVNVWPFAVRVCSVTSPSSATSPPVDPSPATLVDSSMSTVRSSVPDQPQPVRSWGTVARVEERVLAVLGERAGPRPAGAAVGVDGEPHLGGVPVAVPLVVVLGLPEVAGLDADGAVRDAHCQRRHGVRERVRDDDVDATGLLGREEQFDALVDGGRLAVLVGVRDRLGRCLCCGPDGGSTVGGRLQGVRREDRLAGDRGGE
jgi:hypothetical protein